MDDLDFNDMLQEMLQEKREIDFKIDLVTACYEADISVVESMLYEVTSRYFDDYEELAEQVLECAISSRIPKVVEMVLNELDFSTSDLESRFLRTAVETGKVTIVELILPYSDCVSVQNSALLCAVEMRNIDIVKLLLEKGCTSESVRGNFCYRSALGNGDFEMLKLLKSSLPTETGE